MSDKRITPDQALTIMRQINESMFGQVKFGEMIDQSRKDMEQLLGIGLISKRDKIIFAFAIHTGIKFGVAYSHALANAQKPLNILKSFFTRRTRK